MKRVPQVYYDQRSMEPVTTYIEVPDGVEEPAGTNTRLVLDKKVSIVIACWNQLDYTRRCLESIVSNTHVRYELILVDNGSTDGTGEYLEKFATGRPNVRVIHNRRNLGFGPGNNVGFRAAVGDYVCCLNNDTIVRPGWLRHMLKCLIENPHVGMVGPVGASLRVEGNDRFVHIGGTDEDGRKDVHYIEGWCFLISRKLLGEVGLFDESFGLAFSEDADLSFRVRDRGYTVMVCNNGSVVHFGSKTVRSQGDFDADALSRRNNQILYRKWGPRALEDSSRILIVRQGAMGDALMCTPVVRAIREKFPGSHIGFATDCPEILQGLKYIDEVISMTKFDESSWSKVYRLSYESEPGENAVEVMARQAGVTCVDKTPEIVIPRETGLKARFMRTGDWVVVHTGRSWPNREWLMPRWRELLRELVRRGFQVAEVGDWMTELSGIGIDCRGMKVHETAALIKEARLFVGIDSLCAHLAKAVGTPAVVIYGCVDPRTRENGGVEYPVWIRELECRGCRNRTDAEYVTCAKGRMDCVERITVQMVFETIGDALKGRFPGDERGK